MTKEKVKDRANEDELSETERQKPMTKGDKKELVDQWYASWSIQQPQVHGNRTKEELTKQNNELIEVRNDVRNMKKRLEDLERKEVSTAETIEKKIRENAKKQEKRRMFENKVKTEIEEEEKKILVVGFPIANSNKEATLPGLVASMMWEEVTP